MFLIYNSIFRFYEHNYFFQKSVCISYYFRLGTFLYHWLIGESEKPGLLWKSPITPSFFKVVLRFHLTLKVTGGILKPNE